MSDHTPLEMSLVDPKKSTRPTPLDVFDLARKMWLKEHRINLGALCEELGIGRATLSRWIGTKDRLLREVLWSLYEPVFLEAQAETPGQGPNYVAEVYRRVMWAMIDAKPLNAFVKRDPQYALGILTVGRIVERRVEACRNLLEGQVNQGHLSLPLDLDTTAFVITRLNESFVYSDAIVGTQPAVDKAVAAIRVLTGGGRPEF